MQSYIYENGTKNGITANIKCIARERERRVSRDIAQRTYVALNEYRVSGWRGGAGVQGIGFIGLFNVADGAT